MWSTYINLLNTLALLRNDCLFANDFRGISERFIMIQVSVKFVPMDPEHNWVS